MEKVINCFKKRPDAVTRLICFPWAGGGSTHYARWGNVLSSAIEGNTPRCCLALCTVSVLFDLYYRLLSTWDEPQIYVFFLWNQSLEMLLHFLSLPVFAVKLPGRESRAKEPFFQNMQQIVDEVVGVLLPLLKEKPFALFGHRYDGNRGLKVASYLSWRPFFSFSVSHYNERPCQSQWLTYTSQNKNKHSQSNFNHFILATFSKVSYYLEIISHYCWDCHYNDLQEILFFSHNGRNGALYFLKPLLCPDLL